MKSNGFATILLMIPVLTVPALAIFGIPQFAPVVASPLEETPELDRETRPGNSARSREEMFDDVEGFNTDPSAKRGTASSLRKRDSSRIATRDGTSRRSKDSANPAWGDDLESGTEWPGNSRRSPPAELDEPPSLDRTSLDQNRQAMLDENIPQRYEKRLRRTEGAPSSARPVPQEEVDQGVVLAGFEDDTPEPPTRRVTTANQSRSAEPRNSGQRETVTEPLTWAAAVEQLNEYDIRNFRLEPGDRSGQFVFICTYASPEAPTVSYRFEAGADEPLKAVEKVLEQIVAWRQKQ